MEPGARESWSTVQALAASESPLMTPVSCTAIGFESGKSNRCVRCGGQCGRHHRLRGGIRDRGAESHALCFSHLIDFSSGKVKQRNLVRIFLPLILASYFGSLTLAIWMFPGPFDWRTRSMSKLLYPSNNPQFHAIGSAGVAVTGLLIIPFAGYIGRGLRVISPVSARSGALALGAGAISLILGGVIVLQPFLHEIFARGAGICVGVGMLAFYWCALRGLSVPSDERYARRLFLAWTLIVPPALLVVVLRLLAAAHFQWSNPVYRAIENRSLWHLGFWEWIGSTAVFLFLLGAALFLPEIR